MLRKLVPLFGLAFVSVGSLPAAPVPTHLMKKGDVLYFPTTVGTKWLYRDTGNAEVAYEVSNVEDHADGKFVTVTGGHGPCTWLVSPSGLFITAMGTQKCDPPTPMLRLPLSSNKKWEFQQKGGPGLKGLFAASGPEEVEVKAGKFITIKVETEWVGNNKPTVWYAPGVGVIKSERGLHLELLAFIPVQK
jgi:hypothetical protein